MLTIVIQCCSSDPTPRLLLHAPLRDQSLLTELIGGPRGFEMFILILKLLPAVVVVVGSPFIHADRPHSKWTSWNWTRFGPIYDEN